MRLRKKAEDLPLINVIPMIDIMFFLLVFFMLSTMYMTNLRTVQVKLSSLPGSQVTQEISFAVTVNGQGNVFIGDRKVDLSMLQRYAERELQRDPNALIVLRTDADSRYESFAEVIAVLKQAGASRIGIAAEATETGEGS